MVHGDVYGLSNEFTDDSKDIFKIICRQASFMHKNAPIKFWLPHTKYLKWMIFVQYLNPHSSDITELIVEMERYAYKSGNFIICNHYLFTYLLRT